jgi:hypothetical protein
MPRPLLWPILHCAPLLLAARCGRPHRRLLRGLLAQCGAQCGSAAAWPQSADGRRAARANPVPSGGPHGKTPAA